MRRTFLTMALLTPLLASGGEPLYLQAASAQLLEQPRFGAQTVAVIQKGESLEPTGESGRWRRVVHQGREGWLPGLLLGDRPPLGEVSVLDGRSVDLEQQARRRPSGTAGVAAARGLRDDARNRLSNDVRADYGALQRMEHIHVSASDLRRFMEERDQ